MASTKTIVGRRCPARPYTARDDALILEHVRLRGETDWSHIGQQLGREGGTVRSRWRNFLDPKLVQKKWSDVELELLRLLVETAEDVHRVLAWFQIGAVLRRGPAEVRRTGLMMAGG